MTGDDLAAAALSLVGTPYRLHGRHPAVGLDCLGLFSAAVEICGISGHLPQGYGLRLTNLPAIAPYAAEMGFAAAVPPEQPGDVVFVCPGPAQLHLLIAAGNGQYVHAHAGLRRVVVSGWTKIWQTQSLWRHGPL